MFTKGKIALREAKLPHQYQILKLKILKKEKRGEWGGSAAPPPLHPLPKAKKNLKEVMEEKADRVFITASQHASLLKKANLDEAVVQSWYDKLSSWKIGKSIDGGKSDYQSIVKWVIDAVKENFTSTISYKNKESSLNESLVKTIEKKFESYVRSNAIAIGSNYIEFSYSAAVPSVMIRFTDHGFREQVLNNLRKMRLPTDGL